MKNKTTLIHTKALWCTRTADRDRNLLRAVEYDLRACIPAGVRGGLLQVSHHYFSSGISSFTGSSNKIGFIYDPVRSYASRSVHMCINICRRRTH